MKIKNKLIKKIVINGLIGSLLLNSVPFYSFANNEINTINTNEAGNIKEISPQMIAVLSSLAIGSGITITTNDDIYDLSRMFYDYVKNNNELTWDFVQSAFLAGHTLINNYVHVDSNFLDIIKGFFESEIKGKEEFGSIYSSFGLPYFDDNISDLSKYYHHCLPISATNGDTNFGDFTLKYVDSYSSSRNNYDVYYKDKKVASDLKIYFDGNESNWIPRVYIKTYNNNHDYYLVGIIYNTPNSGFVGGASFTISKTYSNTISFPYNGGYTWDNVESKKENDSVALPIPGNLGQLVGQGSDDFWDNTDGLINPCTQEIILPEVENPSISIGESIRLQTEANCSIYNAEELVTKAEESKDITDIENARNEVNKLPEGDLKEELQNRLDAITPNITLSSNSVTANLDVYIKSENSLVMTLDTSSITFDEFSSVEDIAKENAVTVTIKSSLPYELNSYLVQEITNIKDDSKTLDKSILNIKANGTDTYNTFEDIGTTPIMLLDNQNPGETNNHGIDFMLDADIPYENGNYKTVIKFEAQQK